MFSKIKKTNFNFFLLSFFRDALKPFATDSTMGSYVGMTNFGDYGGIAYQPAVCGDLAYRTAVVQNGYSDMETAEVASFILFTKNYLT